MKKIEELQEQRLTLQNSIKALGDKQAEWKAEDEQEWDKQNAAYDAVMAELDAENKKLEREAQIANRFAQFEEHNKKPANVIGRDGASLGDGPLNRGAFEAGKRAPDMALALQGWMRSSHDPANVGEVTDAHRQAAKDCGFNIAQNEIRLSLHNNYRQIQAYREQPLNTLGSHTETAGGYTFGETFIGRLELAMKYYGGMLQVADVIRTTDAHPMRWPTSNDTTNTGIQLGEGASVPTNVDPTFAQALWFAYKFSSQDVLVPYELLRDNAVNLGEVLSEMLGVRLGRIQNTKFTTGSGAGTAKGIVTAAPTGVTAALSTSIAYDELIDLEHSIDPARRNLPGVGYMFHDSILKAFRKVKDGEGRYLWMSGSNAGAPDRLNDRPYTINQDMASAISSGNTTVIFGQLTQYKIRQVNAIRMYRLTERYRDQDCDAFLAFVEADGNLLDAGDHPVKALVQP